MKGLPVLGAEMTGAKVGTSSEVYQKPTANKRQKTWLDHVAASFSH